MLTWECWKHVHGDTRKALDGHNRYCARFLTEREQGIDIEECVG